MIKPERKKGMFRKLGQPDFRPAIEALKVDLHTVKTNAPINEREGNLAQARLERTNAKSYQAAIGLLLKKN